MISPDDRDHLTRIFFTGCAAIGLLMWDAVVNKTSPVYAATDGPNRIAKGAVYLSHLLEKNLRSQTDLRTSASKGSKNAA